MHTYSTYTLLHLKLLILLLPLGVCVHMQGVVLVLHGKYCCPLNVILMKSVIKDIDGYEVCICLSC
jgi:hypothetical protein